MIFPSITTSPFYAGKIVMPAKFAALGVRHYNPSIADFQGKRWICWRVEYEDGLNRLALGELQGLKIVKPKLLKFGEGEQPSAEDPRLFVLNGNELMLQFTDVDWHKDRNPEVQLKFCTILDMERGALGTEVLPLIAGNGERITKNWTMFEAATRLMAHEWPEKGGVLNLETLERHFTPPCHYPFGTFSGRTPALKIGDRYLAIGGGHAPHETATHRCYITAYTFAAKPPFEILEVSAKPLMYASDDDDSIVSPRDGKHAAPTIFPAGLILDGEDLLLSAGVNDSWMCLLRIPMKALNLQSVSLPFSNRMVHEPGRPFPPGGVLVRVKAPHPIMEPGGPYHPGETFVTTARRAGALQHLVEEVQS